MCMAYVSRSLRLCIAEDEPPLSEDLWQKIKWVLMCMQGRGTTEADLRSVWSSLVESPLSFAKRGVYIVNMPHMVRMAWQKNGMDCDGKVIPPHVLQFQGDTQVDVRPGLYTCKLRIDLSNASWRLGSTSFIEGRGACTVKACLFDFCYIKPIPTTMASESASFIDTFKDLLISLFFSPSAQKDPASA